MNNTIMKSVTMTRMTVLLLALGLVASAVLLSGCPDRVTGNQVENQKPVVYFVNVPPDGYSTSRNPVIYWIGTDPDGQVKLFRYIVVLETEMGSQTPEQYRTTLLGLPESRWTYMRVDDSLPNPQTREVVRMSASITDPVNEFVRQYVFLQAFDEAGLGSDIVFRAYQRNDNPPQTYVTLQDYSLPHNPYINARQPGGVITGMRVSWFADDKLDYPADPPPFEYEWKLFGPYESKPDSMGEFEQLMDQFVARVFVANDGKVYRIGQGEMIIFYCDSLDSSADPDTLVRYPCDTLFVDEITGSSPYGVLDSMLLVDDPTFQASDLYRPVDGSAGWISATSDTLYDVYRNAYGDGETPSTVEQKFILWVRCRDDASVPDLVPAFTAANVIDPQYERDILLVDFQKAYVRANAPVYGLATPLPIGTPRIERFLRDTTYMYWKKRIELWDPSIEFDTLDYWMTNINQDYIPLRKLLSYKVAILYNDDVQASGMAGIGGPSNAAYQIYKAVDAGVNVWSIMRAPLVGGKQRGASNIDFPEIPDLQYQRYFGISAIIYSGWWNYATADTVRIEDFTGAVSLNTAEWPDLTVDTAQLHGRYAWGGLNVSPTRDRPFILWTDTLGCLPEVGWAARHYGTEPLYLYQSLYGPDHPLGPNASYAGSPVATRLETNVFRTAHFSFTPMGIRDAEMQQVINKMLDWLYPANLASPSITVDRYPGAKVNLSAESIRRNDAERAGALKRLGGAISAAE